MSYPALPDRRITYDNDGSIMAYGVTTTASAAQAIANGPSTYVSGGDMIELNDGDYTQISASISIVESQWRCVWIFFPERREVTAHYYGGSSPTANWGATTGFVSLYGSLDSTNGVDGTWETASLPAGYSSSGPGLDKWRANIKAVSFTGGKTSIRFVMGAGGGFGGNSHDMVCFHLYGEKAAGQTPDDLIFIDHDTTPGVEFQSPEDFGDRPLGTTVTRQFRVKNASTTKTANTINLQCNDSDFVISTDGTTWVVTINIGSLAAGAESATMYVRNTTPAAGNLLGPRFAKIVAIVGSWV